MPKYIVTANVHLHVKTDAEGRITERKRYRRGSEVTLSEGEADRLVRAGGLRLASESGSDSDDEGLRETLTARAATLGATDPAEVTESPSGVTGGDGEEFDLGDPDFPGEDDGDESEAEEDEFEDMSYPDLQKAAKDRDLNAGGSAEDLRARIREHEASNTGE